MAYQLPLRFIKVSEDVVVCATRIVCMMSTKAYQARRSIKDEKRAGTLINASGRKTSETAIFLDNGNVIASPYTIGKLIGSIERSNAKYVRAPKVTSRFRVYDVADEEPNPELDEEVPEVTFEDDEETDSEEEKVSEHDSD